MSNQHEHHHLEKAIQRAMDQVVRISRPDGGSGTGILLSGDRVLTCLHVVDGAAGLYIRLHSGEKIEADCNATAPEFDLALLTLRSLPASLSQKRMNGIIMQPEQIEPGQALAAIGHPFGLDWTVTAGHYNALRQPGESPLPDFGIILQAPLVQVDVAINPGNSGGPIISESGHLVGIADSILNPAIANNIGFAIAAQTVFEFWEAARDRADRLVAYTCGHFHQDKEKYCPMTGKPVQPLEPVPMPGPGEARFSCGHNHPEGSQHCPRTGKPIQPLEDFEESGGDPDDPSTVRVMKVTCSNCGNKYSDILSSCPKCGKPKH
jgi:hypothetical protein